MAGTWNLRVIEFSEPDACKKICEVFYKDGKPYLHNDGAVVFWYENEDANTTIERMRLALEQPYLKPEDFQP